MNPTALCAQKIFRLSAVFLLGGLLCLACEKKSEPASADQAGAKVPSGIPPLPPHERDPAAAPTGAPAGEAKLPPGHPPIGGAGHGVGTPGATAGAAGEPGTGEAAPGGPSIAGEIVLAPKLKEKAKAGAVLFLSVRQDEGGTPGQVLAVDRFETKSLPVRFSIDGSKAMVPGTKFSGNIMVMARIDQDGDAMTKSKGDLQGMVKAKIPSQGIKVTIDTVLP